MAAGCRSMCGAFWTSSPTSGRSQLRQANCHHRSREISASIILQSQSQLKTIYKDAADTIVGNCDITLFLGGKEKSTLKEISELLGKETIDSSINPRTGAARFPTASTIKNWERICHTCS